MITIPGRSWVDCNIDVPRSPDECEKLSVYQLTTRPFLHLEVQDEHPFTITRSYARSQEVRLSFRLAVLALVICHAATGQTQGNLAEGVVSDPSAGEAGSKSSISFIVPAQVKYRPLTPQERWKLYLHETYISPGAYFRATGAALGEHLKNEPSEWGQGTRGYAQRAASVWARSTLADTYEAASAAALGQEVRYVRCRCSGFGPRFGYAVTSSLFTRDRSGRIVPAAARIGGEFAAEYTAKLWRPERYQTDSRIAQSVLLQTGFLGMINTLREFAPELKRAFHRR